MYNISTALFLMFFHLLISNIYNTFIMNEWTSCDKFCLCNILQIKRIMYRNKIRLIFIMDLYF